MKSYARIGALLGVAALCLANSVERIPTKKKGAGSLFQIHYGGKWGFMDRTGRIVIPPRFDDVSDFFEGLARVYVPAGKARKACFINEAGELVIACNFDEAGDFSEGLAAVRIGRRWGYIDHSGKIAIPPQFQAAGEFREGLGRVLVWDQIKCGDRTYSKTDAPARLLVMHDGVFLIMTYCYSEDRRFGFVNKQGKLAIKPTFYFASDFCEGLAVFQPHGPRRGKRGFIDKAGAIAIPAQFDQAYSFSDGLAPVAVGARFDAEKQIAGKWGYIDRSGSFAISARFEFAGSFSEGLARAEEQIGSWGYIDKPGRFAIAAQFSDVWDFSEGLASVWTPNGGHSHIDRKGNKVLALPHGRWSFSGGLTVAGEDFQRYYYDRQGKAVAPYEIP